MSCLFPRNLTVQSTTGKFMLVPVPCGKCPECLKKTRLDWFIRNKVELQTADNAFFITLTYNEENLPISECNGKPCFSVTDVQKFLKRFRKNVGTSPRFKYFLASEYGGNFGRPHYHALFYNIPHEKISSLPDLLAKSWNHGFVSVSRISDRRISYVCKYMLQKTQRKKDYGDPAQAPFYLSSRRPAIGAGYLTDDNICYHLANKTTQFNLFGLKTSLPSYYKRKIFEGYEDIKEEIRNDYLAKVTRDILDRTSDSATYHAYHQKRINTIKNSIRRFKKYSKEHFEKELDEKFDFIYRTIK